MAQTTATPNAIGHCGVEASAPMQKNAVNPAVHPAVDTWSVRSFSLLLPESGAGGGWGVSLMSKPEFEVSGLWFEVQSSSKRNVNHPSPG